MSMPLIFIFLLLFPHTIDIFVQTQQTKKNIEIATNQTYFDSSITNKTYKHLSSCIVVACSGFRHVVLASYGWTFLFKQFSFLVTVFFFFNRHHNRISRLAMCSIKCVEFIMNGLYICCFCVKMPVSGVRLF